VRTGLSTYVLAANVERLAGSSAAGQRLTGNALDNVITGLGGADTIEGGLGADQMTGGGGNDVYGVDNAGDVVIEAAGGGTADEVRTSLAAYTLTANVEILRGTSAAGQSLTGNTLDNVISGGSGADVLNGGAGADILAGRAGNDVYVVDNAGDRVLETAGQGVDEIRTTLASYSLGTLADVRI
jgi:Ca2+-binding RTX toxin-like protein